MLHWVKHIINMARKTDEELKQHIQFLQTKQDQAVQLAYSCRDEIMCLKHVLADRAEAANEKKSSVK